MNYGERVVMGEENIRSEHLNGIYRELAEMIGVEAVMKIHSTHRGQTISLPVELFNKEYIAEKIMEEYDGTNVKYLATKFGYCDKWIRKIIKEYKDK